MSAPVTATLDANAEECGPLHVRPSATGEISVAITGTITVTLQRQLDGTSWVAVESGYTSSVTKSVVAPGKYRLLASGTSGGSAVCWMKEYKPGD